MYKTRYVHDYMYTTTYVEAYTCSRLHLYTTTAVQNCTCTRLHMYTTTSVQNCTCSRLHMYTTTSVQDCTCSRLHMHTTTSVQDCTCTRLHLYTTRAVQDYIWEDKDARIHLQHINVANLSDESSWAGSAPFSEPAQSMSFSSLVKRLISMSFHIFGSYQCLFTFSAHINVFWHFRVSSKDIDINVLDTLISFFSRCNPRQTPKPKKNGLKIQLSLTKLELCPTRPWWVYNSKERENGEKRCVWIKRVKAGDTRVLRAESPSACRPVFLV